MNVRTRLAALEAASAVKDNRGIAARMRARALMHGPRRPANRPGTLAYRMRQQALHRGLA